MVVMRHDGRAADQLRPVKVTRGFTRTAAGSVLWEQGGTVLWCTASITQELPPFFAESRAGGWVTAEYVMLPASTPTRKPWPKTGHTDSRGTEIQRLIGRALRAVVDLSKLGPHTIAVDCQVLQADGGTRTAAICGAYVALVDAVAKLPAQMPGAWEPRRSVGKRGIGEDSYTPEPIPARYDPAFYDPAHALTDELAAVSVGILEGQVLLDLDYRDDSRADVDLNLAMTGSGRLVEVQGCAEGGGGFDRAALATMIDLGTAGCRELMMIQRRALGRGT
jgi:ribonuclease PH